jgi:hypothetical protein
MSELPPDAPSDAMNSIAEGLELLDRISDESAQRTGAQPSHSATISKEGDTIEIVDHGAKLRVDSAGLAFNEWDAQYYEVLVRRIDRRWNKYLVYMDAEPDWDSGEAGQKKLQMKNTRNALCADLNELVDLFETVLKVSLPDHYSHFRICGQ